MNIDDQIFSWVSNQAWYQQVNEWITLGREGLLYHALLSILPDSQGLPSSVVSSYSYFISLYYSLNWMFPVDTMMIAILIIMAFEGALMGFRFVRWILNR